MALLRVQLQSCQNFSQHNSTNVYQKVHKSLFFSKKMTSGNFEVAFLKRVPGTLTWNVFILAHKNKFIFCLFQKLYRMTMKFILVCPHLRKSNVINASYNSKMWRLYHMPGCCWRIQFFKHHLAASICLHFMRWQMPVIRSKFSWWSMSDREHSFMTGMWVVQITGLQWSVRPLWFQWKRHGGWNLEKSQSVLTTTD